MTQAGWSDVWHLAGGIVARQPPLIAILLSTGAVLFIVMAVEGLRTSVLSIWRAHRAPPQPAPRRAEPPAAATAASAATTASLRGFSARSVPLAAVPLQRKRKPLTVAARQFRAPRPKIRRHPPAPATAAQHMPLYAADIPVLAPDGV